MHIMYVVYGTNSRTATSVSNNALVAFQQALSKVANSFGENGRIV
jgi:hypothetical protein